jgi:DNA-binding HxlR family transcriptional regulator
MLIGDATKVKAAQDGTDKRVLAVLREAGDKGLSAAEVKARLPGMNEHTLKTSRRRLKQRGLIELRSNRRWYAVPVPANENLAPAA